MFTPQLTISGDALQPKKSHIVGMGARFRHEVFENSQMTVESAQNH
jgi:hypothetical protein